MTSRREFLAAMGAGLGAIACRQPLHSSTFAPRDTLGNVGIQLYTVRSLMSKDFEGTLAQIAGIGYKEVEFAGYFRRTPAQVRSVLEANKLTSPSSHIDWPKTDEAWKQTLDLVREIGHEWATIAWLDASLRKTPDDWKRAAERFNELGRMARSAGLKFAYHNHDFEFRAFDETNGLETLLKNTDPAAVEFEMDIYWVVKGGGDPLDLLERYPNRFALFHAKDATEAPARRMVDVGAGTIDFAKIFAKAKPVHVFVEHDEPVDPLASATASYRHLSNLTF